MAKKKKRKVKSGVRIFMFLFVFGAISLTLLYNLFGYLSSIKSLIKEKESLNSKIVQLEKEEEILKTDIQKLEDPSYVAKYAREKYLYSKDGELIIRIPEDEENVE
ncbi:MAG: septum formation initiator family protein [bacterium]|nr:septum formation initiator family protein [bacterium]